MNEFQPEISSENFQKQLKKITKNVEIIFGLPKNALDGNFKTITEIRIMHKLQDANNLGRI